MVESRKNFYYAISTIIGTMIGVGIFGIPYVLSRAGFAVGLFYFALLGGMILLINLFYGEIILRTPGEHRLVGYAEIYLGRRGKIICSIAQILSFYGALTAYIIVGGQFLYLIFNGLWGGTDIIYSIIFFVFVGAAIFIGLRAINRVELLMNILLLLIFFVIFFFALPEIKLDNFETINFTQFFLPYGVILFALGSSSAIPEVKEILKKDFSGFKKIIFGGTIIPLVITLLFVVAVLGVVGGGATKEALAGLKNFLSPEIFIWAVAFGFLAVTTSFLILGLNLKKVFWYDLKMPHLVAWFLACFVPLFIFLLGSRDFITIISITGGVLGGLEGVIISLVYLRAKKLGKRKPEYSLGLPRAFAYFAAVIFTLGIIYEIIYNVLG